MDTSTNPLPVVSRHHWNSESMILDRLQNPSWNFAIVQQSITHLYLGSVIHHYLVAGRVMWWFFPRMLYFHMTDLALSVSSFLSYHITQWWEDAIFFIILYVVSHSIGPNIMYSTMTLVLWKRLEVRNGNTITWVMRAELQLSNMIYDLIPISWNQNYLHHYLFQFVRKTIEDIK